MQRKLLAEADFETGMAFEQELAAALEAIKCANDAYQRYVAILRRKYDAPEGEWTLTDWAIGFERIEVEAYAENN
jgi:hypothetical protein